ncbi:GNAT family N-acetyltransferase [Spirillospora albida]|uniref:GNAT family N-acetyltransferase n=1 Tax=Spirillospora albida TaxID=58123 RepID=UPI000A06C70E|nr:GNAT family protein [Spirillospora albida]
MIPRHQDFLYSTGQVMIRRLTADDEEEFIKSAVESIAFHRPWVVVPRSSDSFYRYMDRFKNSDDEAIAVCAGDGDPIVGFINLTAVVRGPYQRAVVGYWVFSKFSRMGYMTRAFPLVYKFAFQDLGLHRLEADIQPGNTRSLRLAKRVGFRREGYSPNFIKIGGDWRDHVRLAITSEMADKFLQ